MDVSIILVNYFTSSLCRDALASVREKSKGVSYEAIVVDNSNDPKEFARLSAVAKEFGALAIDPKENLGFGKANNLGAEKAAGKYLFLLNTDTYLINDAITALFDFLERTPDAGIAGANLYTKEGMPTHSFDKEELSVSSAKKSGSFWYLLKRALTKKRNDFNFGDDPIELDGCVVGAALMIRKSLFDELGGFDKEIFMYAEESLLCYRCIHERHMRIFNVPSSKIVHLEGQSFSADGASRRARYWARGNCRYFTFVFGEKEARRFIAVSKRSYGRKAFVCSLLFKKDQARYYRAFSKELGAFEASWSGSQVSLD